MSAVRELTIDEIEMVDGGIHPLITFVGGIIVAHYGERILDEFDAIVVTQWNEHKGVLEEAFQTYGEFYSQMRVAF